MLDIDLICGPWLLNLIGIEEKVIDLFVEGCLMKDFVQFLMDNSNMKPQAVNVRELGLANVALQLLFINKWFELFFKVTKSEMRSEISPFFELFVAKMAVVDGAFLVIALLVGGFVFHLGVMIADV